MQTSEVQGVRAAWPRLRAGTGQMGMQKIDHLWVTKVALDDSHHGGLLPTSPGSLPASIAPEADPAKLCFAPWPKFKLRPYLASGGGPVSDSPTGDY
jgi:hypothetical protein